MASQQYHFLVFLFMMGICSCFHVTCIGFALPIILPRPASTEGTSAPTTASTFVPTGDSTPATTVNVGSEASEEPDSTETPLIEILQPTQPPSDTNSDGHSDTVAFQVELMTDITIPPVVDKVKLGQFVVRHPGQFAIGKGLDMIQGIFEAPCQGIYYFSTSIHIKEFPSDTENLSGSLGLGVCTNNRCMEGSLRDASLSATVPFQLDGFNTQASGFLQLERGQLVTILLESSCNTNFIIKASSSLSIYKVM